MDVWFYIWIGVIVVSIVVEVATTEMVSLWFIGGGIVALILAACGVHFGIQLGAFAVVSLALLIPLRKIVLKYFTPKSVKTNADMVIGKELELLEPISKGVFGAVKVNDVVWTAVGETDDETIEKGAIVIVEEIKGNKLIVRRKG